MVKPEPVYDQAAVDAACLYVGKFFFNWALLESTMDSVMADLFKVDSPDASILTANIRFTDKLYIIHTALQWQGKAHGEAWQKRARKLISRIGRLNKSRNLIAHNLFLPLSNKCLKFYKIEAKGQFEYPTIHWSPKDFERTYKLIEGCYDELRDVTKDLKNRQRIIAQLLLQPSPIGSLFLPKDLSVQGLLNPAPDGILGDPTSPERSPRTNPNPPQTERD